MEKNLLLKNKLIITYSNQKARELISNRNNLFDKVITLDKLINELFEKNSLLKKIDPFFSIGLIYKIIKDEDISYFNYLNSSSKSLDTIYSFILNINRNSIEMSRLHKGEKLDALEKINKKYQEFKQSNGFADIADIEKIIYDYINKNQKIFDEYSEIILDSFNYNGISFLKSEYQKKIVGLLSKKAGLVEKVERSWVKAKLITPANDVFDSVDEIKTAFKIVRKLMEEDENLKDSDICIVTSDISEYAPLFRLYLEEFALKGWDSLGRSLNLYKNKRYSAPLFIREKFDLIDEKINKIKATSSFYGVKINKKKLKEKLINETFILSDKIGIELTETNQLLGSSKRYKHIIFIGTDMTHFPPMVKGNFLYSIRDEQEYFFKNDIYLNSKVQYDELKSLSDNVYLITASYKDKKQLTASIIIDNVFDNSIDLSSIRSVKKKIKKTEYLDSISSKDLTIFDGINVDGIEADHLSASQLNSYSTCPLKYLFLYKLKIQPPNMEEEGFDIMEKGTLMHACFESFSKKVQGIKDLETETAYKIMSDVQEKEFKKYIESEGLNKNIRHEIYFVDLKKGLDGSSEKGLLAKFVDHYLENMIELEFFNNSEFEKEFFLDTDLKPYEQENEKDSYFIKGKIDRFDNLSDGINIIDYKSSKRAGIEQKKLTEIADFKDFQLGIYMFYAKQVYETKKIKSVYQTFNTGDIKKLYIDFAKLATNEDDIPLVRKNATGILYNKNYEDDLRKNIFKIKKLIENGNFGFDNSNEENCSWCDIKNICHQSVLLKGSDDE